MLFKLIAMASAVLEQVQTDTGTQGLDNLAYTFKALSDPARLKILFHLAEQTSGKCCGTGEGVCACDLEEVTGLSQPTVSHHMKCLMSVNLIKGEKKGKWMFYSIDPEGFERVGGAFLTLSK